MSPIEIVGALLGITNVWLIRQRSVLNYPFGIVMTILYTYVFWDAKLYADMVLQVFFTLVQIYGWYQWNRNKEDNGEVVVELLPRVGLLSMNAMVTYGILGTIVAGYLFSEHTDASFPFFDSTIMVFSIMGQLLLNYRRLESWFCWIFIDVIAIPLYYVKGLYPTSALYVVFLIISITGLVSWSKKYQERKKLERRDLLEEASDMI